MSKISTHGGRMTAKTQVPTKRRMKQMRIALCIGPSCAHCSTQPCLLVLVRVAGPMSVGTTMNLGCGSSQRRVAFTAAQQKVETNDRPIHSEARLLALLPALG